MVSLRTLGLIELDFDETDTALCEVWVEGWNSKSSFDPDESLISDGSSNSDSEEDEVWSWRCWIWYWTVGLNLS